MFFTITIIILICIFIANMFSGGGSPRALREIFYGKYYADKGVLSSDDQPNTLKSFQNCIDNNIAIKTDVLMTSDRKIVVCSDSSLSKYGVDKDISSASLEDFLSLGFITLDDLLRCVNGSVPIILELKSGLQNDIFCRFVSDAIKEYTHPNISIASFHSGILAWFKRNEKSIFRGAIAAPSKDFKALSFLDKFLVGNLANNSVARPHYVLYRNGKESVLVKFAYSLGIIKGVWDVKDKGTAKALENTKDMIVFSNFIPENAQYKSLAAREQTKFEAETEKRNAEREAYRMAKVEARLQKKLDKENEKKTAIDKKETERKASFSSYLEDDKALLEKDQLIEDENKDN